MKPEITVAADRQEVCRIAAAELLAQAKQAVLSHGRCAIALSGGSTPKDLYILLASDPKLREGIPWSKTHFFWGDERHVPPDHQESNYRMANQAMLSKVPVPQVNVHRIKSENPDAAIAADDYERELRSFFKIQAGEFPRFDIVLLGLGPEAHTASLFPGTKALHEQQRLVVSNWVGKFYTDRITMTAPVFNHADEVIFLVCGDDKAVPVKAVLEGKYEPEQLPAQLIRPEKGRLLWLLDRAAAKFLGKDVS
jgi:6-phosphogluconolactonase